MAGHWYTKEGTTKYTIIGKNGKERDTNLGDAKKLHLLPSVTTILQVVAKPGLVNWTQNQILEACLNYAPPRKVHGNLSYPGYEDDCKKWKAIILDRSQKIGKDSAKRGTELHDALEQYYKTGKINEKEKDFIIPVIDELSKWFPGTKFEAERSFASTLGFGGKIDLCSEKEKIIIDFKTKKDKAFEKELGYDEHIMQLSAYGQGLSFEKLDMLSGDHLLQGAYLNVFISTETPGKIEIKEWEFLEVQKGWSMFYNLLNYWKKVNDYESNF